MAQETRICSEQDLKTLGYTLKDDLTLHATFDEVGRVINPDAIPTPNFLCEVCSNLMNGLQKRRSLKKFVSVPYHSSVNDMESAARLGCHLCLKNLFVFKTAGIFIKEQDMACGVTFRVDNHIATVDQYGIRVEHFNLFGIRPEIQRYSVTRKPGYRGQTDHQARFSASNASKSTFKLAKSWLKTCLDDHDDCWEMQANYDQPPTRLIEILAGKPSSLRIVYPKKLVPYLTLSHCWGQVRHLTLTKSNHDEMVDKGFLAKDMPQLYKDFILVAQSLGARYIWIDSLCIIQDSAEDWKFEASRMGSVYSASVCTISAVNAQDGEASLFTKLHPLATSGRVQYSAASTSNRELFIGYENGWCIPEPLYTRAWVLQERLLSCRVLEYTTAGIRWCCSSLKWMEPGKYMEISKTSIQYPSHRDVFDPVLAIPWGPQLNLSKGNKYWMSIVNRYSIMHLSHEKDRSYALQGIISVLEQSKGVKFVAGICKDFFPYSLLWRLHGPTYNMPPRISSNSTAPSWSCTFRRSHDPSFQLSYSTLLDESSRCANLTISNDDSGVLHIKGKSSGPLLILPKSGQSGRHSDIRCTTCEEGLWCGDHGSGISHEPPNDMASFSLNGGNSWRGGECYEMIFLDFRLEYQIEAHLVLLTVREPGRRDGLVLESVESGENMWERIGIFHFINVAHSGDSGMAWFDVEREFNVR